MPFIWNNKEYKLVSDNSNWDKLEFVIARKLHVQYNSEQVMLLELHNITVELHCDSDPESCFGHFLFAANFD